MATRNFSRSIHNCSFIFNTSSILPCSLGCMARLYVYILARKWSMWIERRCLHVRLNCGSIYSVSNYQTNVDIFLGHSQTHDLISGVLLNVHRPYLPIHVQLGIYRLTRSPSLLEVAMTIGHTVVILSFALLQSMRMFKICFMLIMIWLSS